MTNSTKSKKQMVAKRARPFQRFVEASYSGNTWVAYKADVDHFTRWGGSIPSTPETVARYLAEHAETLSFATLSRRLSGLHRQHLAQGYASPVRTELVSATLRGIRRTYRKPQRQVKPILKKHLIAMIKRMDGLSGARDRALLLVGFHGAFRRSELAGIRTTDVTFAKEGMVIRIKVSKTDQDGEGRDVPIAAIGGDLCAVAALKAWLKRANVSEGPIFRRVHKNCSIGQDPLTTTAVAMLIKRYATAIGLDPGEYSGHSLRVGLVTSAAVAGAPAWEIRKQTGHKSDAMVARYIRQAELFTNTLSRVVTSRARQGRQS